MATVKHLLQSAPLHNFQAEEKKVIAPGGA